MLIQNESKGYRISTTTATAILIQPAQTNLDGILVASNSSGKVQIFDAMTYAGALTAAKGISAANGSILVGSITLASTEHFIPFYGIKAGSGFLVETAGTVDVTMLYR